MVNTILLVTYVLVATASYTPPDSRLEDEISLPLADFADMFNSAYGVPGSRDAAIGTNNGLIRRCSKVSGKYAWSTCRSILDITTKVMPTNADSAHFGLLDITIEPLTRKLFVVYTSHCDPLLLDCSYYKGFIVVSRFSPIGFSESYDPASEFVLLKIPTGANSSSYHTGASLLLTPGLSNTLLVGIGDCSPSARFNTNPFDECRLPYTPNPSDNARHYTLCGRCPSTCTTYMRDNPYGAIVALKSNCLVQPCSTGSSLIKLPNGEPSLAVAKGIRMPYYLSLDGIHVIVTVIGDRSIEQIYRVPLSVLNGHHELPWFAGWNVMEGPFSYYHLNASYPGTQPAPDLIIGSSTYNQGPQYLYAYFNHTNLANGIGNSITGAFKHTGNDLSFDGIVTADYTPMFTGGLLQRYLYVDASEPVSSRVKKFNVVNAIDYANSFIIRTVPLGGLVRSSHDYYILMIDPITFTTHLVKLRDD